MSSIAKVAIMSHAASSASSTTTPHDNVTGTVAHDDHVRTRHDSLAPPAIGSLGRALQNVVNAQRILSDTASEAVSRSTSSTAPGSPRM